MRVKLKSGMTGLDDRVINDAKAVRNIGGNTLTIEFEDHEERISLLSYDVEVEA